MAAAEQILSAVDEGNWFAEHGFDKDYPDQFNQQGDPALIVACRQGRDDIVATLLARGVNCECLDQYGNNAVWACCYAESEACLYALLKAGCDLNYQNPSANTVLAYAASSGKDNMVRLLLQQGADPRLENKDGMTALDLASTLLSFKLLRATNSQDSQ